MLLWPTVIHKLTFGDCLTYCVTCANILCLFDTLCHNLTFRSMWQFVSWVHILLLLTLIMWVNILCLSYYFFFSPLCGASACSGPWLPWSFSSNLLSFFAAVFQSVAFFCHNMLFIFGGFCWGFETIDYLWGEVSLTPNTWPGRPGFLFLSSISLKTWPACAAHWVVRLLMTLLLSLLVHPMKLTFDMLCHMM